MTNTILVVAPHPDDEILGCGGTLIKHAHNGDVLHWLLMTEPPAEMGLSPEHLKRRETAIKTIHEATPFATLHRLGFPTLELDMIPLKELVGAIGGIVDTVAANIIYLPFGGDVHSDHRVTFEAVWSATKTFRSPGVREVYVYETISETEFAPPLRQFAFQPDTYHDISLFLDRKLDLMEVYEHELGLHPFPRSAENIKALAARRGTVCGCRYAEAFMCLKRIIQ